MLKVQNESIKEEILFENKEDGIVTEMFDKSSVLPKLDEYGKHFLIGRHKEI